MRTGDPVGALCFAVQRCVAVGGFLGTGGDDGDSQIEGDFVGNSRREISETSGRCEGCAETFHVEPTFQEI